MLKPSVGLMVVMSSPLMRRTTVVLPALSRPLHVCGWKGTAAMRVGGAVCVCVPRLELLLGGLHHEQTHLLLLLLDLLDDGEQAHACLLGRSADDDLEEAGGKAGRVPFAQQAPDSCMESGIIEDWTPHVLFDPAATQTTKTRFDQVFAKEEPGKHTQVAQQWSNALSHLSDCTLAALVQNQRNHRSDPQQKGQMQILAAARTQQCLTSRHVPPGLRTQRRSRCRATAGRQGPAAATQLNVVITGGSKGVCAGEHNCSA
jgi:hypothetical protein